MSGLSAASVSTPLACLVVEAIRREGGWIGFDRFMEMALYEPGLGYYSNASQKFGLMPDSGSDFVTAPELSPLFGLALANQLREALDACRCDEIWEFGAGSGALAEQVLGALGGDVLRRYVIVDLSGALRGRQRARLEAHLDRVEWVDKLPDAWSGVVIGNELLDAMPVQLIHFDGERWLERGVGELSGALVWSDRPTTLRPPVADDEPRVYPPGTTTELHRQAEAFISTLAEKLTRGVAFFIDYGFPEAEYYHPQRSAGTLLCHRGHRVDGDPLVDVGAKDITAHVDFTGIALAAQDAGLDVLGYTSQARFLLGCGLLELLLDETDVRANAAVQKLLAEHEMGELFKVIAIGKGCEFEPCGFRTGDRRHRL